MLVNQIFIIIKQLVGIKLQLLLYYKFYWLIY